MLSTSTKAAPSERSKPENPWLNLGMNILLPVLILERGAQVLGDDQQVLILLIALSFPLFYGSLDYFIYGRKNWISLLGLVSVAFTGGFALLSLEGIWFALKEAAFPLLLGLGVMGTAFTKKPLAQILFLNDQILNTHLIHTSLQTEEQKLQFRRLLRKTTIYFSGSFFLSSLLNFVLARSIFSEIPITLSEVERSRMLNEQISQMTWMGFAVIALPLLILSALLIWWFLNQVARLTQKPLSSLFPKTETH